MEEGAPLLLVSALLVAPMLSGCVAVGFLDEPGTSPDWQAGYAWEHERSGQVQGEIVRDGETVHELDETRDDVTVNRTVVNTTLEADGDPIYVLRSRVERDDHDADRLVTVRQRDLAPVGWTTAVATECVDEDCSSDVRRDFGDAPEWTFLDFPLVPGKTWTIEPDQDDGELRFEVHAEVGSSRTADLPIGPTEVLPVTFTVEPTNLEETLDDAEEQMEDHGARIDRFDVDLDLQLQVDWSPQHQVPARIERRADVDVQIRGTDEDGEPIDTEVTFSGRETDALAEAHLEPGTERAPSEIEADGTGSLIAPPTQAMAIPPVHPGDPPARDGSLRIVASTHRPNAAQRPQVDFRIVGADDNTSEGARVRWSIEHPDHGEIESGIGTRFLHQFTEPGSHVVRAQLTGPEGEVIDRASETIVAQWSQQATMSCDVVATAAVGGCDPVSFPVASGIDQLVVALDPNGVRARQDRLRVVDAAGETVAASGSPDYLVAMDDFDGTAIDGSLWSARYEATAAGFSSPEVAVEARYGAVIHETVPGTASDEGGDWRTPVDDLLDDATDWPRGLGQPTREAIP